MKKFALVGDHISHSYSQMIHQCIFKELDLSASYEMIAVPEEDKDKIFRIIKDKDISGFSVTMPYKQLVMKDLYALSPEAEKIGAVNTVVKEKDGYRGYNTDYNGFGFMLDHAGIDVFGKSFLIYGAGGACRAVILSLLDKGASSVTVCGRSDKRFPGLKKSFPEVNFLKAVDSSLLSMIRQDEFYGLVNTSPLGMYPDAMDIMPFTKNLIEHFETVSDVVYNPGETKLLKAAKDAGAKTAGGLLMLIYQAVKAEEYFWDIKIEGPVLDSVMESCINAAEGR